MQSDGEVVRRPTRQEIAESAQRHVSYKWARSPGTHDRDIEWTAEDTATYNEEFDKAKLQLTTSKPVQEGLTMAAVSAMLMAQ